jgi:hypothetical protein
MREWFAGARGRAGGTASKVNGRSKPGPATVEPAAGRFADLEALAALHDRGVLSDEEFKSEKVLILNGS